MKSMLVSVLGAALASLCSWTTVSAHHSTVAFYDNTSWMAIEGTVVKVFFQNPHVSLQLEVVSEDGETEIWAVETGHRAGLEREVEDQWLPTTLQPGDSLIALGHPGKRTRTSISAQGLTRPSDGWRWRWAQALESAPPELRDIYEN